MIDELVSYNREFVKNKGYEKYITNKYPDKVKSAIVSCMGIPGWPSCYPPPRASRMET